MLDRRLKMNPCQSTSKFLASMKKSKVQSLERTGSKRINYHAVSDTDSAFESVSFESSQSERRSADSAPKNDSTLKNGSSLEG